MGKRGPPKTPSKVLKSRRTFRKDRHSDDLEAAAPPALPPPPDHLSEAARQKWLEVGSKLAELGLCSGLDAIALELLISAYCGMQEASQTLANEDLIERIGESGMPIANPLVNIVGKHLTTLKWCLREFGMTPSARTSIRLPEKPQPVDPMARLLAAKQN